MSAPEKGARPANPHRGETSITVLGRDYVLRPSFEALIAAEEELGSLFALVEEACEGRLSLAQMAALIWHCLPPETRPERPVIGKALIDMGLLAATRPVRAILSQVLKGVP